MRPHLLFLLALLGACGKEPTSTKIGMQDMDPRSDASDLGSARDMSDGTMVVNLLRGQSSPGCGGWLAGDSLPINIPNPSCQGVSGVVTCDIRFDVGHFEINDLGIDGEFVVGQPKNDTQVVVLDSLGNQLVNLPLVEDRFANTGSLPAKPGSYAASILLHTQRTCPQVPVITQVWFVKEIRLWPPR